MTLRDGRVLDITLATIQDAAGIAREHPVPRSGGLPRSALMHYYEQKVRLYVLTPRSGIVVGRVEGQIAGFVCYSGNLAELERQTRSPRMVASTVYAIARGKLGGPRLWVECARWVWQHFRSGQSNTDYPSDTPPVDPSALNTQIGTVHTVDAFRRLGVATALLDAAEAELRNWGARQVALWVAVDNAPALKLYDGRGYERRAEVARLGESCWLMEKHLG